MVFDAPRAEAIRVIVAATRLPLIPAYDTFSRSFPFIMTNILSAAAIVSFLCAMINLVMPIEEIAEFTARSWSKSR